MLWLFFTGRVKSAWRIWTYRFRKASLLEAIRFNTAQFDKTSLSAQPCGGAGWGTFVPQHISPKWYFPFCRATTWRCCNRRENLPVSSCILASSLPFLVWFWAQVQLTEWIIFFISWYMIIIVPHLYYWICLFSLLFSSLIPFIPEATWLYLISSFWFVCIFRKSIFIYCI